MRIPRIFITGLLFALSAPSLAAQTKIEHSVVRLARQEPTKKTAFSAVGILGSGFFVAADGRILTAHHVVVSKDGTVVEPLYATFTKGAEFHTIRVKLVRNEKLKSRDIALLVPEQPIKVEEFLERGESPESGEDVLIAGFPAAFPMDGEMKSGIYPLLRRGIVASKRYTLGSHKAPHKALILDLPVRPGNSGSPVIELRTQKVCAVITGMMKSTDFSMAAVLRPEDIKRP